VINAIAGDKKGTFHALGSIDKTLRKQKQGLNRLRVKLKGRNRFVYAESGEPCTTQEALFHYFELPLSVIRRPRVWYSRHRTPAIAEYSKDRRRVLVRFDASSLSGTFGGMPVHL
jgi:hypothetical protein